MRLVAEETLLMWSGNFMLDWASWREQTHEVSVQLCSFLNAALTDMKLLNDTENLIRIQIFSEVRPMYLHVNYYNKYFLILSEN
jgi:hypothetical protein